MYQGENMNRSLFFIGKTCTGHLVTKSQRDAQWKDLVSEAPQCCWINFFNKLNILFLDISVNP